MPSENWKLIEANFYQPAGNATPGCPNTTWCTGAGMYDGWWTNDPYRRIAYNATQRSLPASDLKNGGLWLFDLAADRAQRRHSNTRAPLAAPFTLVLHKLRVRPAVAANEETNVAAANPDVVSKMRSRLAALADPKNGYRHPQENIPDRVESGQK